jgi:1,4-alpha-glucan branching enzyme
VTLISDYDVYLFREGRHFLAYEKLGSHVLQADGLHGVFFAVWAPNALSVSVMGDFNDWRKETHPLKAREDGSGIFEGFIPGVKAGTRYKYFIVSRYGARLEKSDPYALFFEGPPGNASYVWNLEYEWKDKVWMESRGLMAGLDSPISIYEVHLGSWRRVPEEGGRFLTYREVAPYLVEYVKEMGFTHVEFLPLMEHPFYGSWGYQVTGYFAPTNRYGRPEDLMYLIDVLHQNGIGVILDWVPSHFARDPHGLSFFDGTHLYEHMDWRKGFHPHWTSYIFNYGRKEVRDFLISSALFWLEKYHVDGLRVDAVASMLYLDYGRKEGEWIPNIYGGRENLEAMEFLKTLNEVVYERYPDVHTIAEESTCWPAVSRPTYLGGLGFGMKWNMGWMHDALEYFSKDPVFRKYHHDRLTFSLWYAFSENFVLPLSHDEVVYGKGSVLRKMPGDDWQKFANLRLLLGYMFAHPGKKLVFMGSEFGQWDEWYHERSLDWHLLSYPSNQGVRRWLRDLNVLYRAEPCLHELDFEPKGFEWVDFSDWEKSIISFLRKDRSGGCVLVALNFTPVPRFGYRVGVPKGGWWKELLNSDAQEYGGSGIGNLGRVEADPMALHGRPYSLPLTLPPLAILFLKPEAQSP